jgi:hypothetical protein
LRGGQLLPAGIERAFPRRTGSNCPRSSRTDHPAACPAASRTHLRTPRAEGQGHAPQGSSPRRSAAGPIGNRYSLELRGGSDRPAREGAHAAPAGSALHDVGGIGSWLRRAVPHPCPAHSPGPSPTQALRRASVGPGSR